MQLVLRSAGWLKLKIFKDSYHAEFISWRVEIFFVFLSQTQLKYNSTQHNLTKVRVDTKMTEDYPPHKLNVNNISAVTLPDFDQTLTLVKSQNLRNRTSGELRPVCKLRCGASENTQRALSV